MTRRSSPATSACHSTRRRGTEGGSQSTATSFFTRSKLIRSTVSVTCCVSQSVMTIEILIKFLEAIPYIRSVATNVIKITILKNVRQLARKNI